MFTIDPDPAHDRPFADVALFLEEWYRLTEQRPSPLERAWLRAGFGISYGAGLKTHYPLAAFGTALVFLPAARATADPVYRAAILASIVHEWEESDRWDVLTPLGQAMAAIAAEDDGLSHGPPA